LPRSPATRDRGTEMNITLMRIISLVALLFPAALHAQAQPDTVKHRNDCRLAAQVLTSGQPAVKRAWAATQARTCPAVADQLANGLRDSRASTDTVRLSALTAPADWLRDGRLFSAAYGVVGDRTATVQARVFATRVLMWAFAPGDEIGYGHLVDVNGDGRWSCGGTGASWHGQITRGTPLPSDWVSQANALGRAIAHDGDEPRAVRQAAVCLALASPQSERLEP
jgi:hypothetical protein